MRVRVLLMIAAAAACAHPSRGPGYDAARVRFQAWTEDSAIFRAGPHRGEMIAFSCVGGVRLEVGQGKVCPLRLRQLIAPNTWQDAALAPAAEVSSSDTSVVLASANGLLIAQRPGSAAILAKVPGASALLDVTVFPAIESFHWVPDSVTMRVGDVITVRPVLRDAGGREIAATPQVTGAAFWGPPGMVGVDSVPGWRELVIHAVAPGRAEIFGGYGARHATLHISVF